MPFHSKKTLEHWVAEFVEVRGGAEAVRVVVQETPGDQDTGLVIVPLENAPHTVWMEPRSTGDDLNWHVVIEQSDSPLDLTSFELNALTHELQIAAELCAFLQEKSLGSFDFEAESSAESEAPAE
ncbi:MULTISPECIES: hypothetical protein [Microbacterium]|uniref:hypothetical protein n=1 Tax=Microbacterium TaxID=33882 RepID=UPI00277EE9C3|nr:MULTISPECIES: hypothetical protein [Microbacterium]MDQ1082552.1 hypothetical protein [Microbacterium sp. SORGH_AS_0344]MDQ1168676.1 hypothetical protein [Microbacterium proteolyticum]